MAATILVVRPGTRGPELLMLQRADKGDHNSGAWVFPGGLVDSADRPCHACCTGIDDAQASHRLGLPAGGLDFYVAAIRESFEEAGLLFAVDAQGAFAPLDGSADSPLAKLRQPLGRGDIDFGQLCRDHGLRLAVDQLHYIAHWITPAGLPKRFDTRFFLALCPPGQQALHDAIETLDHRWVRPADMLADVGTRKMLFVTQNLLRMVAGFDDMESLLGWAAAQREVKAIVPRRCRDARGLQVIRPGHAAWPEVGLLDPQGAGTAWCELPVGLPIQLSPGVHRLSHAGGNSYLVGDAGRGWLLIDPPAAQDAAPLLQLTQGLEAAVLSTAAAQDGLAAAAGRASGLRSIATPDGMAWLLPEARIAFTGRWIPVAGHVPAALREVADWAAPGRGFLVPLA